MESPLGNNYVLVPGEHIGYRYIVDSVLDSGSFGTVAKCMDMKEGGQFVAIKIPKRNEAKFARREAKMLSKVMGRERVV